MANNVSARRYDKVAIALHWLVALGVFVMVGLGWYMVGIAKGTPPRAFFYNLHKSIGVTVAIIVLVRVVWRWNHQPPPLPPGTASWVVNASRLSHSLLYALLVLMPVAGFTASNFTKYGVTYFGLFKIGPLFAENKALYELFQGIHHAASEVLVIVIGIHIAGALKHLLIDRDGVFFRILPGRFP
ncbi:MAG TPA: cytochrome b [Burkholderiales bacterium]|nr:cytochrome b [Burkholderiales bacterium]